MEIRPQARTDKQFDSATTAESNCWGIFKTLQHTTPMVYCQTEEIATRIKSDPTYPHYDSRYTDCVIKKITKPLLLS